MSGLLQELVWRQPLWGWLALYPWLVWGLRGLLGHRAGQGYADPHLTPWAQARNEQGLSPRSLWRHAVLVLAWALFAATLAGPRLAQTAFGQQASQYPQLMVVLDLSRSMTARDVAPSRLQRARLEIRDLIERADRLRVGLVVFAARPHLLTPLTTDKAVLRHRLPALRHGLLPTEGSDLRAALVFAVNNFTDEGSARAILLVTDGDVGTEAASMDDMLADTVGQLRQQGITLHVLGIGTPEGAAVLGQDGGWLQHQGQAVVSRLHEDRLSTLARLGQGRYSGYSETDAEWRVLYDHGIADALSLGSAQEDDELIVWSELYAWTLIPAVLLLLLAQVQRWQPLVQGTMPLLLALVGLSAFVPAQPAQAAAGAMQQNAYQSDAYQSDAYQQRIYQQRIYQQRAYQAYLDQSYAQARRAYAGMHGYTGRMGEGGSAYRMGEYPYAVQQFILAILDANSDRQRADALFNLANSHYRLEHYAEAANLYRDVLRYRPQDAAAQRNRKYALRLQAQQQSEQQNEPVTGQGRGPRTARLPEGTDITRGDVRLDDSAESVARPATGPVRDLVGRGIHYAHPVTRQLEEFEDSEWVYQNTSNDRIVLQAEALEVDEAVIWQRLFEAEEGFPAPLDKPHELVDLPPW